MLDRAWIAAHIPHQGSMCLLEQVLAWDTETLTCSTTSHTDPDNPLRQEGRLGIANGIEYAAQAMAVHGTLLASQTLTGNESGQPPRSGYLTSVRNVQAHALRLDTCDGPLLIHAQRLMGDDNHLMYQFELRHQNKLLLAGRASVMLDAGKRSAP